MAKKVGTLIREARTAAGFTQEQLAKKIKGLTASDIGKAERGEKTLTQDQLKEIAKATGVTQKSLLEASKGKAAAGKTSAKTEAKKTETKKTETLTAAEKKLVELYRAADAKTKKAAVALLKGESGTDNLFGNLLENAVNMFTGKK